MDEKRIKSCIRDCIWDIEIQADHETDPEYVEALKRIYSFLEGHFDEI